TKEPGLLVRAASQPTSRCNRAQQSPADPQPPPCNTMLSEHRDLGAAEPATRWNGPRSQIKSGHMTRDNGPSRVLMHTTKGRGQLIHTRPRASAGSSGRCQSTGRTRGNGAARSQVGARSWADLPAQAVKYVRRIEELAGTPVSLLSISPERDDTVLVRGPFENSSGGRPQVRSRG